MEKSTIIIKYCTKYRPKNYNSSAYAYPNLSTSMPNKQSGSARSSYSQRSLVPYTRGQVECSTFQISGFLHAPEIPFIYSYNHNMCGCLFPRFHNVLPNHICTVLTVAAHIFKLRPAARIALIALNRMQRYCAQFPKKVLHMGQYSWTCVRSTANLIKCDLRSRSCIVVVYAKIISEYGSHRAIESGNLLFIYVVIKLIEKEGFVHSER